MINHTYIQGQFFIVIRAARLTENFGRSGFFQHQTLVPRYVQEPAALVLHVSLLGL